MSLTSAQVSEIVNNYKCSDNDTGSPEVQVSLITSRIVYLTEHFKTHKKDNHSRQGLLALVNKRRKLLRYLKRKSNDRYYALIEKLKLRDSY
jgi:small subunit ribosomal protein S15